MSDRMIVSELFPRKFPIFENVLKGQILTKALAASWFVTGCINQWADQTP